VNAGTRIWPPTLKKDPRLDATTTAPRTPCGQPDTSSPNPPAATPSLNEYPELPTCTLHPGSIGTSAIPTAVFSTGSTGSD
jgi:hypothetical protein